MLNFGSGVAWGTPLTDAYGSSIANPTPVPFSILQDISVDISFDSKELHGQKSFAIAKGRGKGKIGWKAKSAQINGALLNSMFFGQTLTTGLYSAYKDTVGTTIPATPFTVTPTIPGAGAWAGDLGVLNNNGVPMTYVASSPTSGQYSVTAGAYLFAAADVGNMVYISYRYTSTSTVAKTLVINNMPMGSPPSFRLDLFNSFETKGMTISIFKCSSDKLSLATKLDDFLIPEFDGSAIEDSLGRIAQIGLAE